MSTININYKQYYKDIIAALAQIRHARPLVHNITNYVVMQSTANALLALGASPIMAHALEEMEDITQISNALVINIGTLDSHWLPSMRLAMQIAKARALPIILDPVGAGATRFRTQAVLELIEAVPPNVIRGNAAEILALAGEVLSNSKGVDSQYQSDAAYDAGRQLADRYQSVVVISGAQDLIISSQGCYTVSNGVPMMSQVTGMGCTATALIGAFCAVNSDYFFASTFAMAVMGLAGELAMQNAAGPGSFQVNFMDVLFNLHGKMGVGCNLQIDVFAIP
jgi:hydroxyethylthiazole kinase